MVTVWHFRPNPDLRFVDLGSDFSGRQVNEERRTKDLVRHVVALDHLVTFGSAG